MLVASYLYVGIDVAFAKKKKLPICITTLMNGRLEPLRIVGPEFPEIPRGTGNVATLDDAVVALFVKGVHELLIAAESYYKAPVHAIAIDAPSDFAVNGRRKCEQAMDQRRISCFATPSSLKFDEIKQKVRQHLLDGRAENCLPHGNQLWMLVGFALFQRLRPFYRCLEVFPQATASVLGRADIHKFKKEGTREQLEGVAERTGWNAAALNAELKRTVPGHLHDKVDAFLCAWIASLYPHRVEACGMPPNDVIWVPKL